MSNPLQTKIESFITVIGAGLAGLSAAQQLIASGHLNVLIVEAKDKPGGRISSIQLKEGSRVDLGAQWLHGGEENPLYKWLFNHDLIEGREEEETEFEGLYRSEFGKDVPDVVVARVLEIFLDTRSNLYKMSELLNPDQCKPIDLYRNQILSQIKVCPILRQAERKYIDAIMRWFELYEMIDNSCESFETLSVKAYTNWINYDEGELTLIRGGWSRVVQRMTSSIGEHRIRYNSPVTQVVYTDTGVELHLENGQSILSDHVIYTASLGVLQKSILQNGYFDPPLSREWVQTCVKLGFGVVNKVFLIFEAPYLIFDKGVKFLWTTDHKESAFPQWTKYLTGFEPIRSAPNVLLGWVGGEGAKIIETISEEDIGSTCQKLLSTFVPDKPLERLVSVIRTTWFSDPHIRGAYSYESYDASNLDTTRLWEPLFVKTGKDQVPRILFAGEATAGKMHATAHGAILSGRREAERLDKFLTTSHLASD